MAIFTPYTERIAKELPSFLPLDSYPMYGMMRYFMGFADEKLVPATVYGGKRFRSALTLLVADLYGALELALPAALSVELFHNFTLIHDDIVDNDTMRRGRPTVWKLWGVPHAINSGDGQLVLVYRALQKGTALHPERGARAESFVTDRYLEVIEGQYLDFVLTDLPLGSEAVTAEAYFEMIKKKTSVLVGAATKVAGIMAGLPEAECDALYRYGESLGMAIQLHDDYMSVWGSEAVTGKARYGDLKEKKKTLPILFTRDLLTLQQPASEEQLILLTRLYAQKGPLSGDELQNVACLVETPACEAYMKAEINRQIMESHQMVDMLSLPDAEKQKLRSLQGECMPG